MKGRSGILPERLQRGSCRMAYEGSIRRRIREWRERRVKGQSSSQVDVDRVLDLLYKVDHEMMGARANVKAGDFSGAHTHIQVAHEKLREASRLIGFRPKES